MQIMARRIVNLSAAIQHTARPHGGDGISLRPLRVGAAGRGAPGKTITPVWKRRWGGFMS